MPFHFTCPYCFKKTLVDESLAGQDGPCAGCGKTIQVPEPPRAGPTAAHPVDSQLVPYRKQRNPLIFAWIAKFIGLAIGIAIVGSIASMLLWPTFEGLKARRDRTACINNLQLIARALNAYAAEHGAYPPPIIFDAKGKPMHSWRVLILPQLGQDSLFANYDFDEPWDSPNNSLLFQQCPQIYRSPAADDNVVGSDANYMLVTGKGTLFPPSGPLGPDSIQDPLDGTLLIAEVFNTSSAWTQPLDIDVTTLTGINARRPAGGMVFTGPKNIGGNHEGGATAVFADGTPAWLPADLAPELLDAMISPAGGEPINPADYRPR